MIEYGICKVVRKINLFVFKEMLNSFNTSFSDQIEQKKEKRYIRKKILNRIS